MTPLPQQPHPEHALRNSQKNTSIFGKVVFPLFLFLIIGMSFRPLPAEEPQGVPPLKVVCFTPKDKTAPDDRHERLGRVLKQIQEYYRKEMAARGYGPMTFALEWDSPDKLKIYDVPGKENLVAYPKGTEWQVHAEVKEALRSQKIDIDQEYLLILGVFVEWKDGIAVEYGPYSGIGNLYCGCAFACDDKWLDSDLLSSKEPGGFHYMTGPCSFGKYNTLYVGGIAHELGHCFGLPHDCELDSQRNVLGVSLMGTGNHHYGEELREEGPGAFLSEASALRLAASRAFNPEINIPKSGFFDLQQMTASFHDEKLMIDGRIKMDSPIMGAIAYNDNLMIPQDYDAKAWVTQPDDDGVFHFEITELEKVPYQLRIAFIVPGGKVELGVEYSNTTGIPTLEPINTLFEVAAIKQCLDQKNYDEAENILKKLCEQYPGNPQWARKLKHLEKLKSPPELFEVKELPEDQKTADLTWAKTERSEVGWYHPSRAILCECGFMQVDSAFFESGIYAHPASRHVFALDKKWKEFEFVYGIQNGKPGSVVFVVLGDNQELFRSQTVKANELHFAQINVNNVEKLELITEDADDGWANDWGLWLRPTLIR